MNMYRYLFEGKGTWKPMSEIPCKNGLYYVRTNDSDINLARYENGWKIEKIRAFSYDYKYHTIDQFVEWFDDNSIDYI